MKEEYGDWNGHKIHLDTYRNPKAKAKLILLHGVGTNGSHYPVEKEALADLRRYILEFININL